MDSHRPGVTDFVHIGLVVEDLDETVRFLALLGFDCGEPGAFSGEAPRSEGPAWRFMNAAAARRLLKPL